MAGFGHILVLFIIMTSTVHYYYCGLRFNCPVDKISVLNEVHYMGDVAYLRGTRYSISFIEIVIENVVIKGGMKLRKCDFTSIQQILNLNV